jgi:hypothetical protein
MKVVVLSADYRKMDVGGLLDMERTLEVLQKAKALMETALQTN